MTNEAISYLQELYYKITTNRVFAIKAIFLVAMMLWGHHRGLIHLWPAKIPIAHGINQILGAVAGLVIGIIILFLTNILFGW